MVSIVLAVSLGMMGAAALLLLPTRRFRGLQATVQYEGVLFSVQGRFRKLWRSSESSVKEFEAAVRKWVDLLYVAASCGMTLSQAVRATYEHTQTPLTGALREALDRTDAGGSLLQELDAALQKAGTESLEVIHLLTDSTRQGLPLAPALLNLRRELLSRERHRLRASLKTLGLRVTLGTVFFLFPPAFVVIVLPNILAFLGW